MIRNNLRQQWAAATNVVIDITRNTISLREALDDLQLTERGPYVFAPQPDSPETIDVVRIQLTDRVWELFVCAVPLADTRPGHARHRWVGWETKFGPESERRPRIRSSPDRMDEVVSVMKDTAFLQQCFRVPGWRADGTLAELCFYSAEWPASPLLKRHPGGFEDMEFPGEPKGRTWSPPTIQEFHPAGDLAVGDVVAWRFPFTVAQSFKNGERVMVSGDFDIPATRPKDERTWDLFPRAQPLRKGVTGPQWPRMIDAIAGQFPEEVFPRGSSDLTELKSRMRQLGRPAKSAKKSTGTGIFRGYPGNQIEFAVGSRVRLLWELARSGQSPVWVVDSPETLACYIFTDEQAARDWASGTIDHTVARQRAQDFVVHQGEWEARIDAILAALGVTK